MSVRVQRPFLRTLLFAGLWAALAACADSGLRLGGAVHDPEGQPIAGADVSQVNCNGAAGATPVITTGPDGRFQTDGLGFIPRDCVYAVTKPGYSTSLINPCPTVDCGGNESYDVTLEPLAAPTARHTALLSQPLVQGLNVPPLRFAQDRATLTPLMKAALDELVVELSYGLAGGITPSLWVRGHASADEKNAVAVASARASTTADYLRGKLVYLQGAIVTIVDPVVGPSVAPGPSPSSAPAADDVEVWVDRSNAPSR
jgi:hypothetical protein